MPAWSMTAQAAGSDPEDPWAGTYRVTWVAGSPAAKDAGETRAVVSRAADADPAKAKGTDLHRWTLGGTGGADASAVLRRFEARDYDEFGWAVGHAAGTIECLNGSSLFICRTKAGAKVAWGTPEAGQDALLPTRTGMFGVALHAGAFELARLK